MIGLAEQNGVNEMNDQVDCRKQTLCDARLKSAQMTRGFTLLEILLVLALIALLLGGLASLIRVFSNSYYANERRVGRAQLARSISQMLEEDLGSAVQDPIQAVAENSNRLFIRHFGLRGDSRSLQIDVVQPSLFAKTSTAAENQQIRAGGDKTSDSKHVPELKTIFYEFVPINAVEELNDDSETQNDPMNSFAQGEDLGATLAGSLSSNASESAMAGFGSDAVDASAFLDGTRPLVRKFGLSRRELDFETPDVDSGESNESGEYVYGASGDSQNGSVDSILAGSLTAPPSSSNSTLASSDPTIDPAMGTTEQEQAQYEEPLTAVQIAMDADDGTTWAPEVLDCRFSYFNGNEWRDSWDSIENKGLPIAIKVELKLAPIDDVDLYRSSPMLFSLPVAPSLDEIDKFLNADAPQGDDGVNTSRLTGSLNQIATSQTGTPVDVFNSYRPLQMIRAAREGVVTARPDASPFATIASSAALTQSFADEENATLTPSEDALGGSTTTNASLGGGLDSTANLSSDPTGMGNQNTDPAMQAVQEMLANGAVFNDSGVCVDYSNDGSYVTLEQMATELGVSQPEVYEVIVYLATTPLSRATTIERRRATVVRQGNVSQRRNVNNSSRDRRAQGANPYATGRARQAQSRQANDRTFNERNAQERRAGDRQAADRQSGRAGDRQAADRQSRRADRQSSARSANERQANRAGQERAFNLRSVNERAGRNGGWTDDNPPLGVDLITSGNNAGDGAGEREQQMSFTNPGIERAPADQNNENPNVLSGGLAGGLAGNAGANQTAADPFAIIDQQASDALPFASSNSGFDMLGGMTTPGLIETPTGANTVASPTSGAPKRQTQQQTWIRGKR